MLESLQASLHELIFKLYAPRNNALNAHTSLYVQVLLNDYSEWSSKRTNWFSVCINLESNS